MSEPRKRMIRDMELRNFSPATQRGYLSGNMDYAAPPGPDAHDRERIGEHNIKKEFVESVFTLRMVQN